MDLWIIATLFAVFFQTLRFALQKVLSTATLSAAGSTFARFFYASPLLWIGIIAYFQLNEIAYPKIDASFWIYAVIGGIAQILATVCVVVLFKSRNFAVGITLKKSETILTAIVGYLVLGDTVSLIGGIAIIVGLFGVLLLSKTSTTIGLSTWFSKTVGIGLASGLFFAFSAVSYRSASLMVMTEDPFVRASITLLWVVTIQLVTMLFWLHFREKGQISAVWQARNTAFWVGITSLLGSLCWFVAFTLQNAAYVSGLGQSELLLSVIVSILFFKERITSREYAGIALLTISVVALIIWV